MRTSTSEPLVLLRAHASLKCPSGRAKRGSTSGTTEATSRLSSLVIGSTGLVALLSMRVMRTTSTTSNARALWQTASTRPSPYFAARPRESPRRSGRDHVAAQAAPPPRCSVSPYLDRFPSPARSPCCCGPPPSGEGPLVRRAMRWLHGPAKSTSRVAASGCELAARS